MDIILDTKKRIIVPKKNIKLAVYRNIMKRQVKHIYLIVYRNIIIYNKNYYKLEKILNRITFIVNKYKKNKLYKLIQIANCLIMQIYNLNK